MTSAKIETYQIITLEYSNYVEKFNGTKELIKHINAYWEEYDNIISPDVSPWEYLAEAERIIFSNSHHDTFVEGDCYFTGIYRSGLIFTLRFGYPAKYVSCQTTSPKKFFEKGFYLRNLVTQIGEKAALDTQFLG